MNEESEGLVDTNGKLKTFVTWQMALLWLPLIVISLLAFEETVGVMPTVSTTPHEMVTSFIPLNHWIVVGEDYEVHFTVDNRRYNSTAIRVYFDTGKSAHAIHVGTINHWNYFAAPLDVNTKEYRIGDKKIQSKLPPKTGARIAIVGDTKPPHCYSVFKMIEAKEVDLLIHLGDLNYASNDGGCYSDHGENPKCAYNCSSNCIIDTRQTEARRIKWSFFLNRTGNLFDRVPIMTQQGNHDNDRFWQYGFIPHSAVRTRSSFFFSTEISGVHIISITTEDNAMNPYERWYRHDQAFDKTRFDESFGIKSDQYNWLKNEVQKPKTGLRIIYTHRPIFHTSGHHPMCGLNGDWYRCELMKLYGPLLSTVDHVVSGHSHHYMRSKPLKVGESVALDPNGTVFSVIGTGGFELDSHVPQNKFTEKVITGTHGAVVLDPFNHTWTFFDHTGKNLDQTVISIKW